jgi:glucose/arabinose dehydrogenase
MKRTIWMVGGALLVAVLVVSALLLIAPREAPAPAAGDGVSLSLVADGLEHPVAVASADGIDDRVFVVDQTGVVRMLLINGILDPALFLDLRDRMVTLNPSGDERGLLSIAFHPDYATNHKLYAFYSAPLREGAPSNFDHTNIISELTASEDGLSADGSTERVLLSIDHPSSNHNGGKVLFGPDGFLYITTGDGGGGNDMGLGHNATAGNAQDPYSIHGKVLRVDVDAGEPYDIPADNPYAGGSGLPEIYALGFRNPAYAAFDQLSGDLLVADAGQARYEEVDLVVIGGNYGWRFREGANCFDPNDATANPSSCPSAGVDGRPLIDPIAEFKNANLPGGEGRAVIGGAFYHGSIAELKDGYVFGAFDDGSPLFVLHPSEDGTWTRSIVTLENQKGGKVPGFLLAVSSDINGDILVLSSDSAGPSGGEGKIWRLTD